MTVEITVEVDHYLPAHPDRPSSPLLQSPVSPERQPGDAILVRQRKGQFRNEVSFMPAADLNKVTCGSRSTYAHGVLIKSSPDRNYLKGDRVWLTETAHGNRAVPVENQTNITAVNLRTWESINVALGDVCWIPKFRKIDCDEDEEELLTISGPPVRKQDRKLYLLAIVQRLRLSNDTTSVEKAELREITEQDSFKYLNLPAVRDGEQRISELFRRSLASVATDTSFGMELQGSNATPSNAAMPHDGRVANQPISLVTPPPEEDPTEDASPESGLGLPLTEAEDEPDVRRKMQELQRAVEANKARRCKPLIPAGPPPEGICNLGKRCPTPPKVFFLANRPSLENLYPRHHHRPDRECPKGASHQVHCVFRFQEGRSVPDKRLCIVPATLKHHCCETNARPVNKQFCRRPTIIEGGKGSVQVTGGRGTVSRVSELDQELEQHCGFPAEVCPLPFVAERDLDEVGRHVYGYHSDLVGGSVEGEGSGSGSGSGSRPSPGDYAIEYDGEDDDTAFGQCQLDAIPGLSREHQQIHKGRSCVLARPSPGRSSAPGSAASHPIILEGQDEDEEEPDVFGDRHFCADDGSDEEMELHG